MKLGYNASTVISLATGIIVSGLWFWSTGGAMDTGTYKWLASVSATLAGFVFTVEQLLMIIMGDEDSLVSRIIRERNPEYLSELLRITGLSVLGYFPTAVLSGALLLFGAHGPIPASLLHATVVFTIVASSCLLLLLIVNVQLVYEDYLELDLKRRRSM